MELEEAKSALRNGEIVVFPTETAYGIAADARKPDAVEKVYEAKQRPRSKGLTVICSGLEQAKEYGDLTERERRLVEEFMPGPLTLVSDGGEDLADNLNDDFVFRISSSRLARELASDFPITATSANISGEDTSYAVEDVSKGLLDKTAGAVDHGRLEESPTSTIAEVSGEGVEMHREGPITLSMLEETLDDE